ncbi:MAG: hypothetical protein EZS28_016586 [Streblomastix strix]|uniref:Uncharacterized protein n=1 Tax=Streblomastix strix TaxID=222440 RepID=A0A5J4VYY1_9EUKA|nr:MAG: hypothetical protein EZS28_016586 [Streblomastix strix]
MSGLEIQSERTSSYRSLLSSRTEANEIHTIIAKLGKLPENELKDSLLQLLFIISSNPEGYPIQGGKLLIQEVVKVFSLQKKSEIQALCINILISFNAKTGQPLQESHIHILCTALLQSIQSMDSDITEGANLSLIQTLKKMKEIRQFLVQRGEFLRKAGEILLLDDNSTSSSLSKSESSDHIKSAVIDILVQLSIYRNLIWDKVETQQLIKVLQTIAGSENQEKDEESIEGKAQQLVEILNQKIQSQRNDTENQSEFKR